MFPRFAPPRRRQGAIALVIVLSCLALMTVLIVAFLANVTTELSSSTGFANSNDARQKSQLAVNLVMAQIQDATGTNPNQAPTASDPPVAWASQPGMIRTYDATGSPTGTNVKQYKLYSSGTMIESAFKAVAADGTAADVDANWATMPAAFVDLNSPVANLGGQLNYPIVDPGARIPDPTAPITTTNTGVEGFKIALNTPKAGGTSPNLAPMPVRWMYVLKDGKLRTTGTDGKTVADAGDTNPIVSRFAFWTDDDTCKVNINTAAGDTWTPANATTPGSFAGIPLASNPSEAALKNGQPVQHEYQRYPGHPATTYLSAVFPGLLRPEIFSIVPKISPDAADTTLTPYYSAGGTVTTIGFTSATKQLPVAKSSHLYASVDELRFRAKSETASNARSTNAAITANLTPQQVEQAEFFLTAHSRAPEVNLFNKPRVCIWPEDANPSYRTTFDNNIAFCSTVGGRPFYFVRDTDLKPDTSGTSNTGNTSSTIDVGLRNEPWSNMELYSYLSGLMSSNIPGFGGSFIGKYNDDSDQILTEIFDYVRCTNLCDVTSGHPYASSTGSAYTSAQLRTVAPGQGHVVPAHIESNDTRGFGRSFTLYAPIIEFFALKSQILPADLTAYDKNKDGIIDSSDGAGYAAKAHIKTQKVQAVILLDTFSPSQGVVRMTPNLDFKLTGLEKLNLGGTSLGFASSLTATFDAMCKNNEFAWGGITSAANMFRFWDRSATTPVQTGVPTSGSHAYPLFSGIIDVDSEYRAPLAFGGGSVTLEIYARNRSGAQGEKIQSINLTFPSTSIPTPVTTDSIQGSGPSSVEGKPNYVKNPSVADLTFYDLHGGAPNGLYSVDTVGVSDLTSPSWQPNTGTGNPGTGNTSTVYLNDAIRILTPTLGDMRLVMARTNVANILPTINSPIFIPEPGFGGAASHVPGSGYSDYDTPLPAWKAYTFRAATSAQNKRVEYNSGGMVAGMPRGGTGGGKWSTSGSLVPGAAYNDHTYNQDYNQAPAVQDDVVGAYLTKAGGAPFADDAGNPCLGDWDTGMSSVLDGPYINKPDEGEMTASAYGGYSTINPTMSVTTLFSPNRQVPSPAIFGSLSTGVKAFKPWQTLLFCPNPAAKNYHPGFGTTSVASTPPLGPLTRPPFATPPDHLLLDLFSMPVVEPYAISEPFSTAGKINMNFQIVPFTYLERSTGMQAVLASLRVGAIPTSDANTYKGGTTAPASPTASYRFPLDIDDTLDGFRARFGNNEIFRSASQICEMPFIPAGQMAKGSSNGTLTALQGYYNYWDGMKLTGDNMREQPYAYAYGRLTTKSNSYTVHVWSQTLKKATGTSNTQWIEGKDQVTGEYRGSYEIERFLDPGLASYDPTLPLTAYKFRTVNTKQFTP